MRIATILVLAFMLAIVARLDVAVAFTDLSAEQWAEVDARGEREQTEKWMRELSQVVNNPPQNSVEQLLEMIDRDYGLPTVKHDSSEKTGSLRINFDKNDVIDERDILGLGFKQDSKSVATTVSHGSPNGLVLLLKFSDQAPTNQTGNSSGGVSPDVLHDDNWASDHWFDLTEPATEEETSVAYYYKAMSDERFTYGGQVFSDSPPCDVNGWMTSSYTHSDLDNLDIRFQDDWNSFIDVIEDALQQADGGGLDFTQFDSNNDGFLDGLTIIYAGPSPSPPAPGTVFWHFRAVWGSDPMFTADGITINSVVWTGEEAYIRTWIHEFGHELGLPDLYDVGGGGTGPSMPGIGQWGVMGRWFYSQGLHPQAMCGWSRYKLRFVEPVDVLTTTSATGYTLSRVTEPNPGDTLLRIWRNGAPGPEYFLVEYRDGTHGFDDSIFGDGGLCIWHVDETLTTGNNLDNAYDPQRVWLECANNVGDPMENDGAWYSGFNGADGVDYFDDDTTPNAHDNDDAVTGVRIDPTSGRGAATMTLDVYNNDGATIPTLSFDSPADGATVSGMTSFDVTSNAADRVEYFVDGCLKYVENGPGPYSGFSWNTASALDATVELVAVAYDSSGNDPVRTVSRNVTVSNGQQGGEAMIFSENFNGYSSITDPDLLNLWNLHEDNMGMEFQLLTDPAFNDTGKSLAFAQTSFPTPGGGGASPDPNAGIFQGQDDDWLMTPRIGLYGYTDIDFEVSMAFRIDGPWGEAFLTLQITDDNGATWDDLAAFNWFQDSSTNWYTGWWRNDGGTQDFWASRVIDVPVEYQNKDVYFRMLFQGGRTYGVGFALDEISVTGTASPLTLTSVSPDRAKVGDSVTLTGAGFEATQGSGEVRFNDGAGGFVTASITSWSNTQIVCTVPSGAVSNTDGVWVYQGFIESNKLPFTVILGAPNLQGLDQI